jgi:alpha-glucuronidase
MSAQSASSLWRTIVALAVALAIAPASAAAAEDTYDGGDLWLRYVRVSDRDLLNSYRSRISTIIVEKADKNPVYRHTDDLRMEPGSRERLVDSTLGAARRELVTGLTGLLGRSTPVDNKPGNNIPNGAVVVGTRESSKAVRQYVPAEELEDLGEEGYVIRTVSRGRKNHFTVIAGNSDIAALYGTFAFLRLIQTQQPIDDLDVADSPKVKNRHLNNWETVRLYAGNNPAGTGGLNGENGSIFNFMATGASASRNLPVILDRYIVAARALASVGINGFEINLVNANNVYLTREYIAMEAALADALRPYGIKISLAINYTAPTDPRFAPDTLTNEQLDPYGDAFRGWWNRKARELQASIPDFMGFTVKANSEGQPGPQDFGYDHGDGANGIAAAVAPLGMKVYWRTFVYNADVDYDRLKRAYLEFGHIDDEDRFLDNVFLQTKNGPLDYQAREPFHPMFGRLENTNQALELQVTQEYTGQNTMLAYLGPMWEEVLKTDTHATNTVGGSLVGDIVDGTGQGHSDTAIVGVANLGNADNLTGHHFSQANLFAFGRQAWDWTLDSEDVAEDWVRMTWGNDDHVVDTIVEMMMGSWEALVSYQTPLGIGHQFLLARNASEQVFDHYPPAPWQWFIMDDWSPVYYNQADSAGLGFNRSATGSNFVGQYFPTLEQRYGNIETVPENLMMWFHHVPWGFEMDSGRPFWDELVYRYQMGVQNVTWMRETWESLKPYIGARRFAEVQAKLATHEADAAKWRDVSVNYWQEFSERPMPTDDAPLSAKIVVAGEEIGGFDLSAADYTIPVDVGESPRITDVTTADPDARAQIVSQAEGVPGQAVVKVTKNDFFGPIVKNYVFKMVPNTTLKSLSVNGRALPSFEPDRLHYHALVEGEAQVQAVADDPAAQVDIQGGTVTVTNGGASTVYTVDFDTPITVSDWQWVREDPARWRMEDGALVITSQAGDLEGGTNTARNVALQDVNGDWQMDSKAAFSRPLANNNEQGGIVAYADDDNYVKLAWEMANSTAPINKLRLVLLREQNQAVSTIQVTGSEAQRIVDDAIWLRLKKTGDTYRAYYSSDGSVYRFMGALTLNTEPTRAGALAFNRGGSSTDLDVAFDQFRIENLAD